MEQRRIKIVAGSSEITASLRDTTTADKVWGALPIKASGNTWGDEIYFSIPLHEPEADDSQETVDKGAVAYWPPGSALCLFWGPTPTSRSDEIRPASAVNVVRKIDNTASALAKINNGSKVEVIRE